jgi:hypothetical protein
MPLRHAAYGPSNVSFEQSTSEKLTKLVRKLRWSGFEHEADRIQLVLNGVAQDQSSLACRMSDPRILPVVVMTLKELPSGATMDQSERASPS